MEKSMTERCWQKRGSYPVTRTGRLWYGMGNMQAERCQNILSRKEKMSLEHIAEDSGISRFWQSSLTRRIIYPSRCILITDMLWRMKGNTARRRCGTSWMPERKHFYITDSRKRSAGKSLQDGFRRIRFLRCWMRCRCKKAMYCL